VSVYAVYIHFTIKVSLLNHEQTYTKGVFIKDHFRIYCPKKVYK